MRDALWRAGRPGADPRGKSEIEQVLRAQGFTKWDDIEFDDNRWEVDDAFAPEGRKYDLKLDQSFFIIDRKPD
jgi:hypothetical protein